ncbi:MAG TPA: hypothetical protein DCM14_05770 [Clostridiales bacterium UBA8153]|nr:hypothetical protein [Clostridiales bacterium UBA8153]
MSRKINVSVDRRGQVKTDFVGFPGEDCFDEADNLLRALRHFGVQVVSADTVRKSASQTEAERAGLADIERRRNPVKSSGD